MSGFRDSILNMKAIENMYNNIINILVVCSKKMLEDCIEKKLQIQNHEEKKKK